MSIFTATDTLLISEEVFKSMVPSSRNTTDTQTIDYCITMAQNQTIKSLLGKAFYDDVIVKYDAFVNSGTTLEEHYEFLIENYLQPILSFATYKRLINHLSFKLKEGGLRYSVDQNTELASTEDRGIITQEISADISTFTKECKQYLYDNKAYFPLYVGTSQESKHDTLTIGKVGMPRKHMYSDGEQNITLRDDRY